MQQEINLFQRFETPRSEGALLTWRQFWLANLAGFIFFCLMYIHSLWIVSSLKSEKLALDKKADEIEKKFYAMKKTYPQLFFTQTSDVNETIKKLQQEFKTQEEILATIQDHTNFSDELIALAQTITPSTWLTNISLSQNGKEITLKGKSTQMPNLEKFLANLSGHKLFQNFSINLKDVANPEISEDKKNIIFEINLVKKTK